MRNWGVILALPLGAGPGPRDHPADVQKALLHEPLAVQMLGLAGLSHILRSTGPRARDFRFGMSLNLPATYLLLRKLKCMEEGKELAQGHTARKWQGRDLNPGLTAELCY